MRKNVDANINVSDEEALILLFHYLDMASKIFEAGPLMPEMLAGFYQKYSDSDELGTSSKRKFIENLNQEYIDKFDDEAGEEDEIDGEGEGA